MAEQKPEKDLPKITLKSEKRQEAGAGILKQYQTPITILIGVVVIVGAILLTRSPQTPQGNQGEQPILPSNTPVEAGTIQALETEKALLITPTVDPNLAIALTQGAVLALGATDQAATNQAIALLPTQTAVVITSPPQATIQPTQAIIATNLPPIVQPTLVSQGGGSGGVTIGESAGTVCPPATNDDISTPKTVTVTGRAIVHAWWNNNKPSWKQEQIRILLPPDETVTFIDMMGRVYTYQNTPACEAIMPQEFANANFRVVTVQDLVSQGLARNDSSSQQVLNPVWTQGSFAAQSGTVTLGNSSAWVTFQGWDGKSPNSVVHGVIEPGWTLTIPAPFQGTMWTVTDITYDAVTARAMEARGEVVLRDKLPANPPLVYVGSQAAPAGYTSTLPSRWNSQGG